MSENVGEASAESAAWVAQDISWARLEVLDTKKSRTLTLRFGAEKGPRATVSLLTRKGARLSSDASDDLAEALRRSSIEMPVSKDDPSGRFARYNFPGRLTKADAVEVVLNPPSLHDPLPVIVA